MLADILASRAKNDEDPTIFLRHFAKAKRLIKVNIRFQHPDEHVAQKAPPYVFCVADSLVPNVSFSIVFTLAVHSRLRYWSDSADLILQNAFIVKSLKTLVMFFRSVPLTHRNTFNYF